MSSDDVTSDDLPQDSCIMQDDLTVDETVSIECIPDEILEYILSLTSPYCDFKSALLVSKRWYFLVKSMLPLLLNG